MGPKEMGDPGSRFVWYELATTDIEAAKAFYTSVVGWKTEDVAIPGAVFSQFTAGGRPVAGLMKLAGAGRNSPPPQWLGFVGVDDVDAAAGRVRQFGGAVHIAPMDVSGNNRFSVVADPEMAALALVKKPVSNPDGLGQPGLLGQVGWRELLAADMDRAFAFYRDVFGWDKADVPEELADLYQQFSAGDELHGGMFAKPEKSQPSIWLFYFNVHDIDAAATRVEAGGGKVLYGPVATPGGGKVAQCTDPQGALFALMDRSVRIVAGCYVPRDYSDKRNQPPPQ